MQIRHWWYATIQHLLLDGPLFQLCTYLEYQNKSKMNLTRAYFCNDAQYWAVNLEEAVCWRFHGPGGQESCVNLKQRYQILLQAGSGNSACDSVHSPMKSQEWSKNLLLSLLKMSSCPQILLFFLLSIMNQDMQNGLRIILNLGFWRIKRI